MQVESLRMRGSYGRRRLSLKWSWVFPLLMLFLPILKPLSLGSQTHMHMGTREMNEVCEVNLVYNDYQEKTLGLNVRR